MNHLIRDPPFDSGGQVVLCKSHSCHQYIGKNNGYVDCDMILKFVASLVTMNDVILSYSAFRPCRYINKYRRNESEGILCSNVFPAHAHY